MQKPMTDERLGCIENMHPLGLIAELCREIRRLRAEADEYEVCLRCDGRHHNSQMVRWSADPAKQEELICLPCNELEKARADVERLGGDSFESEIASHEQSEIIEKLKARLAAHEDAMRQARGRLPRPLVFAWLEDIDEILCARLEEK